MAEPTITKKVGNLLLALLNATLILAALCLWLAWRALSAAEGVAEQLTEVAGEITPVRAEIRELTEEIALVRSDLSETRTELTAARPLQDRLAGIETQLTQLNETVSVAISDPEALIDRAIHQAFAEIADMVALTIARRRGVEISE